MRGIVFAGKTGVDSRGFNVEWLTKHVDRQ